MKNTTRLSSLMGTWTGQARIKAAVGPYELRVYFVVHFMSNPMRGYGCNVVDGNNKNCNELNNQICIVRQNNNNNDIDNKQNDRSFSQQRQEEECVDLNDYEHAVPWSDVSAFFYFGARVDAGLPFDVHIEHDTGGWTGPLSIILAQNKSASVVNNNNHHDDDDHDNVNVVDQYVARYVESPSTPYLHMNPNCSLFGPQDFERYMGPSAVKETVAAQPYAFHRGDQDDPYAKYYQTCVHGNVKPILPLFDFIFVTERNDNDNNQTTSTSDEEERVEVKLNYKILTFPKSQSPMYKLFPTLQERLNRQHGDFHISGPYCYGDDPKRGWTFDFSYDSKNDDEYMTLVHGCVEGLPCLPSAAEIALGGTGVDLVHVHSKTATFGTEALLTIAVYALAMALLVSISFHCRRAQREIREEGIGRRRRQPHTPGPFGDLGEDHVMSSTMMEQPLLPQYDDDAASECKEDEGKDRDTTANVQFV